MKSQKENKSESGRKIDYRWGKNFDREENWNRVPKGSLQDRRGDWRDESTSRPSGSSELGQRRKKRGGEETGKKGRDEEGTGEEKSEMWERFRRTNTELDSS